MELPKSPGDLQDLAAERQSHYLGVHNVITDLISVYNGEIPDAYSQYFHKDIPVEVINMIRAAVDDLTAMTGKVFPVYVPPRKNTSKAKKEAELVEKVCAGYNDAGRKCGGLGMETLMKRLAWWLILGADAVAMVLPDYDYQTPYFTFRDPRSHLPPVGWTPWGRTALNGTMFLYQCTIGELKRMYPNKAGSLTETYKTRMNSRTALGSGPAGENLQVRVAEFYHSDAWYVACVDDDVVILSETQSGDKGFPGVCPVVPFTMYSATDPKGRSFIADQVGLQMTQSRIVSQKIDFADRLIYPLIFTTAVNGGGDVNYGPGATNIFDDLNGQPPRVEQIVPPRSIDADQLLSFLGGMSRVLNRNPESMQGAGDANSAKALSELKAGVNATVQDGFWPIFVDQMPKLYAAAAKMDINIWGNTKKEIATRYKNTYHEVEYTPNVHLKPFINDIRIEPGLGLGGEYGRLQIMQMLQAGLISRDTAMEMLPEFSQPQEEKRRTQTDKLEEVMFADLATKAANGAINSDAFYAIKSLMEEEELDLFEAIAQAQKKGLLTPPPPPEMPGAEGIPPELMQMMGGAPPAAGGPPPPPLSELRSA